MEPRGATRGVAGWQGALPQTSSRGLRDYYFCSRFERYKLLAAIRERDPRTATYRHPQTKGVIFLSGSKMLQSFSQIALEWKNNEN